jgi:hypothetical protein
MQTKNANVSKLYLIYVWRNASLYIKETHKNSFNNVADSTNHASEFPSMQRKLKYFVPTYRFLPSSSVSLAFPLPSNLLS